MIVTVFVYFALSAAGALFQGIFRNTLVSSDILGFSAGCCFGVALGIVFFRYIPRLIRNAFLPEVKFYMKGEL